MFNFLQQLLGGTPAPAPQTTIPAVQAYSPAMERAARRRGFKNADQMVLWQRQRDRPSGGTTSQKPASLDAFMSWHPANILTKISRSIDEATAGN